MICWVSVLFSSCSPIGMTSFSYPVYNPKLLRLFPEHYSSPLNDVPPSSEHLLSDFWVDLSFSDVSHKLPISVPIVNPYTIQDIHPSLICISFYWFTYLSTPISTSWYISTYFQSYIINPSNLHHTAGWTSLIGIYLIWLYAHISRMFIVTILSGKHSWPVFKTTVFITQLSILNHSTSFTRQ